MHLFAFALLFDCFNLISTLKVLIINPTTTAAHVAFLDNAADVISEGGHGVHMLVLEVDRAVFNEYEKRKRSNEEHHKIQRIFVPSLKGNPINTMSSRLNAFEKTDMRDALLIHNASITATHACEDLIDGYDHWMRLKQQKSFDVGIAEIPCMFSVMAVLKVRATILVSPTGPLAPALSRIYSIPTPTSYVPDPNFEFLSLAAPEFTYAQRAFSYVSALATNKFIEKQIDAQDVQMRARFQRLPPLTALMANVSFLIHNSHPLLDFPKLSTPISIPLAGLHRLRKQHGTESREEREEITNENKTIVLLHFSLLSTTKSIPTNILKTFSHIFESSSSFYFVWKISSDGDERLKNTVNVLHDSDIDLLDVLEREMTKTFITDLSVDDFYSAAAFAVPILAVPLLPSQTYNAAVAKKKGIAEVVSISDFSTSTVRVALTKLLKEKSYTTSCKRFAEELRTFPLQDASTALLQAVEYAARFGPPVHLSAPTSLSGLSLHSVDVIVPLIIAVSCFTFLPAFAIYRCIAFCARLRRLRNQKIQQAVGHGHGHGHSHSAFGAHGHTHGTCHCWRHEESMRVEERAHNERRTDTVDVAIGGENEESEEEEVAEEAVGEAEKEAEELESAASEDHVEFLEERKSRVRFRLNKS